jgi:hypothetical protein
MKTTATSIVLILLSLACLFGCATLPEAENKIPTSLDVVSNDVYDMLWLIVEQDQMGMPVQIWITNSKLYFLKSGGLYFTDENGRGMVLYENYSFTLIKIGEWQHPDYKQEKVKEDERDYPKPKLRLKPEAPIFQPRDLREVREEERIVKKN